MFNSIEEAIEDFKAGKFIVVVDNENRENEGDLVTSAELITAEKINFMTKYARGLICVPICKERLEELKIPQMLENNSCPEETAFTVSVDHVDAGTGISAEDRALTIRKLVDESSKPEDFIRPGHIFPLRAKCNGVLEREGHTEAVSDLAKLAGMYPAGVLCEILNEDGTMARRDDLLKYCKKHNFKIITIDDLKEYILVKEKSELVMV